MGHHRPLPTSSGRTQNRHRPFGVILILLATAFGSWPARADHVVRIAIASNPSMGLIILADQLGYFKEHNIQVRLIPVETSAEANEQVLRGKADLAGIQDTNCVINHLEGRSQRIYSRLHSSGNNTLVVARKDRGIRSAADLAGKTVGVPPKSHAQFFLEALLKESIVSDGAARIVHQSHSSLIDDLREGRLDAIAIWEPLATIAERELGQNAIRLTSNVYRENSLLIGSGGSLSPHMRAGITKVLAALSDAQDYYLTNPSSSYEIIMREIGHDPNLPGHIRAWNNIRLDLSVTNMLMTRLDLQKDHFLTEKTIPSTHTTRTAILVQDLDIRALNEVRPFSVTVKRLH